MSKQPWSSFPCKENHQRDEDFYPTETLKSLGKKGKACKKARKFLATKKAREIQKSKERKIREKGFTKLSVFQRVGLLNPRVRTNFVAVPLERARKVPRSSVRFWTTTGVKQLFGSSREGTKLDWTYFIQFWVMSIFWGYFLSFKKP